MMGPFVILGLIAGHLMLKPLNALLLGESYAKTLGLTVSHARNAAFASTAILAGVITAYCGPVVFLGVAIPHLCRGLFNTSDHRILMPAVTLMGALLSLSADLVTHLPWQRHVLHLNTVNALIGAPVVLWVVLRQRTAKSFDM
jgi:iron complex transport system permease protein